MSMLPEYSLTKGGSDGELLCMEHYWRHYEPTMSVCTNTNTYKICKVPLYEIGHEC